MALESLGIAANVFAVVDMSAKVVGWCAQYAQDVSRAKEDKKRLADEIARLNLASVNVRELLRGPHGSRLKTSYALYLATIDSQSQLRRIERLLADGRGQSRASFEVLIWPFKSKDLQPVIQDLQRCTNAIYSALEADQTSILLDMEHRTALDRLPVAEGASFDSHAEEHNPTCLPNTRVELLNGVCRWIDDPDSKTIFWLNGMAGTGKSTISRTVARLRSQHGDLGASFFFKRGETDRGHLAKFVPTLARQLAWSIPGVASFIKNAIDTDPAIVEKAVREQFDKLILEPLSKALEATTSPSSLVIVIDALNECERDADIKLLINVLSHTKVLRHRLRVFLTSRPELPIRLGFSEVKGTYQDLVLHEMPVQIVEHDISAFLADEFRKIRDGFNLTVADERKLPFDWPGRQTLQDLTRMAVPLFIFAATVCRFIDDRRCGSPPIQLRKVLDQKSKSHRSQLDLTYGPVLRSQLAEVSDGDREQIIKDFNLVVGTIITLASPLSVLGLSRLLDITPDTVDDRLDSLHSVLSVPPTCDSPVRLLHLSFREYLVNPDQKEVNKLWVDEQSMHRNLTKHCFRIMDGGLQQNVCGMSFPGMRRSAVDSQRIAECLPPALQYACLYWAHHRIATGFEPHDALDVYDFLMKRFLHWLEAMCLMGRIGESLNVIRTVASWLKDGGCHMLSGFIDDAARFVRTNFSVIDEAPLQVYSSALVFTPSKSLIRSSFEKRIPRWLPVWPHVKEHWNACLSVLEGHSLEVNSLVFSHDSKMVASASHDKTIRIWNVETGECEGVFKGHSESINSVVFSHDSKTVASASNDKAIRIWNVETGECEGVFEGHSKSVNSVVFSHDSKMMASASSDETIRIWNVETEECERVLKGHSKSVSSVVFSHDSKMIASASSDRTIRIWNVETGECEVVFEGHSHWVNSVVFSHDSKMMASASDNKIQIWNVETGECEEVFEGHSHWVNSVVFSNDSKMMASASSDRTIRIWNVETGECERVLKGHCESINSVVFSHDSKMIASASSDRTIRIWNVETGECEEVFEGHSHWVNSVVFSHDSKMMASASDNKIQIWNVETGECEEVFEGHSLWVNSVVFSHNSKMMASASSDRTIRIWNVETGECERVLKGHSDRPTRWCSRTTRRWRPRPPGMRRYGSGIWRQESANECSRAIASRPTRWYSRMTRRWWHRLLATRRYESGIWRQRNASR
ncbi:hypothetical protein DER44DRAFT_117701 [Fusarium oxysporum]|nr:hypothetical protein DER44DRAFT_117701 [Fusarium oxysporum]